jgi:hypothetical protein
MHAWRTRLATDVENDGPISGEAVALCGSRGAMNL